MRLTKKTARHLHGEVVNNALSCKLIKTRQLLNLQFNNDNI